MANRPDYIENILRNPYSPGSRSRITRLHNEGRLTAADVERIAKSLILSKPDVYATIKTLAKTGLLKPSRAKQFLIESKNMSYGGKLTKGPLKHFYVNYDVVDPRIAIALLDGNMLSETALRYVAQSTDEFLSDKYFKQLFVLAGRQGLLTPKVHKALIASYADLPDELTDFVEHLHIQKALSPEFVKDYVALPLDVYEHLYNRIAMLMHAGLFVDDVRAQSLDHLAKLIQSNESHYDLTVTSLELLDLFSDTGLVLSESEREQLARKTGFIWCGKVGTGNYMYANFSGPDKTMYVHTGCTAWKGILGQESDPLVAIHDNISSNRPVGWEREGADRLPELRESVETQGIAFIRELAPHLTTVCNLREDYWD